MNTNTNEVPATTFINDLTDDNDNLSIADIRAHCQLAGYKPAEVTKAIKELNISSTKAFGFAASFYEWLAEEEQSAEDAKACIMGTDGYSETSKNVKNHLSHYMNIHALSVAIWNA